MNYGRIPLFPGDCSGGECLRLPLFGENCGERWRGCDDGRCQTVHICNPSCPGEYADVQLCVDSCGNLSICVHRPPKDRCRRCRR